MPEVGMDSYGLMVAGTATNDVSPHYHVSS